MFNFSKPFSVLKVRKYHNHRGDNQCLKNLLVGLILICNERNAVDLLLAACKLDNLITVLGLNIH